MDTLQDDLTTLRPTDAVAELVRGVAAQRSVLTDRRSNYLSIRPAPLGAIAFYAYAQHVAIAVDPSAAEAASARLPGSTTKVITPATTHVIAHSAALLEAPDEALAICLRAIDWRTTGPPLTVGAKANAAPAYEPDVCPTCNTEITRAKTCFCDS